MKAKLEVTSMELPQKNIDNEIVHQRIHFNKNMLKKLNERALDKAFQLSRSPA